MGMFEKIWNENKKNNKDGSWMPTFTAELYPMDEGNKVTGFQAMSPEQVAKFLFDDEYSVEQIRKTTWGLYKGDRQMGYIELEI